MSELSEVEYKIIDLVLQGLEKTAIAKQLGISRSWLYTVLNKTHVQLELERRRNELKKTANDKIVTNVCTLVDNMLDMAMNSSDQRVKYNANKYLLDRILGSPTTAKEDKGIDTDNKTTNAVDLKKEIEALKVIK